MRNLLMAICCVGLLALAGAAGAAQEKQDWGLGVQAYTFRQYTFFETVDILAELDVHYVEAYPGQQIGGGINGVMKIDLEPEVERKVLEKLESAGVQWVAFGVCNIPTEEQECREFFQRAKAMGIKTFTAEPEQKALPALDRFCQEFGIKVALHNHPKPSRYWNPDVVLEACQDFSPWIGACADPGHWVRSGLDPVACLKKLEGHIIESHFGDLGDELHDVPWGAGNSNTDALLLELQRQGFKGLIVAEYEHATPQLKDEVAKSMAYAKSWSAPAAKARLQAKKDETKFTVEDLLNYVSIRVADLSADGRHLAVTAATRRDRIGIDNYRNGDPTYISPSVADVWVIDTQSGERRALFSTKRQVRGLKWSPDGSYLGMLVLEDGDYQPMFWNPENGWLPKKSLPEGIFVDASTSIQWMPDNGKIVISVRTENWRQQARERFLNLTKGPIVVLSSSEPFLAWDALRRLRNLRSLVVYDINTGELRELAPESYFSSSALSKDGSIVRVTEDITKETSYTRIGGRNSQLKILSVEEGTSHTLSVKKATSPTLSQTDPEPSLTWSGDGVHYAWARKGNIFIASIENKEPRQLTFEKEEEKAEEKEEEKEKSKEEEESKEERQSFRPSRLSEKGEFLIATSQKGMWVIDTESGEKTLFHQTPEEKENAPRYQVVAWSPDHNSIYLSYASRTEWEWGFFRHDRATSETTELVKDSRQYSGFRLSEDGSRFIFSMGETGQPSELYTADPMLQNVFQLTQTDPQLQKKKLSRPELVKYLDADGKEQNGVVYYPSDYEKGKKYPTIFLIYETFFAPRFNATNNVLTANGYVVMQPSVRLEIGYPGEAWLKGVTAAANKLIELGIADPDRLGVQGTSYGGYATNLLITQTGRFKAAINVSGKVNMVSFYTDSPRLGVRNIHAPERSQDRLGATLWEQPQKYIAHSAVMFADRIETPLLLITGDQDHNVPARQAMEIYYALRRLGKRVEWVNYINGGHGMPTTTVDEIRDYHQRILAWYDKYLPADDEDKDKNKEKDK